ncbi:Uncharacterised protein [Legionella spiritensis]|nr:Uncharacterised protein [Legionella spiritensis]
MATAYEKIHMKLLNYLDYWKNIDLENKTSQDILYLAEMNLTIRFIHSDGSVILEYYGSS